MLLGLQRAAVLSGGGLDSDALLWKAAVVAAGGTVLDDYFGRVDMFNKSLKSAGIYQAFDNILPLWAGSPTNQPPALVDIVSRRVATAINSPTFSATGAATNGTTSYIDTTYQPSVHKIALSQNSGHLSFYKTAGAASARVGGGNVDHLHLYGPFGDGKMYARINNLDSGGGQGTGLDGSPGLFIGDRTGASAVVNEYNGSVLGTDATASTGIPSQSLYIGGANVNGVFTSAAAATYAMFTVGGSLGTSGRAAYRAAVDVLRAGLF